MISFFTQDIICKLHQKRLYIKWLNQLIQQHGKQSGHLSVIFCSDSYIRVLNRNFLSHDDYTDVITFDHSELYNKGEISGDIYISIDTVKINAKEFGASSFEQELVRVMAHGVLHLIGFNDTTPNEQQIMTQQEDLAIRLFEINSEQ